MTTAKVHFAWLVAISKWAVHAAMAMRPIKVGIRSGVSTNACAASHDRSAHYSDTQSKIVRTLLGPLCLLAWLAGCAVPPAGDSQTPLEAGLNAVQRLQVKHIELIATDLVTALIQVRELEPLSTTLQVSPPRGVYGTKLVETLETVGYGLQYVNSDQGVNYLSYANRAIESNAGFVQDFVVRVGEIEVTREYEIVDDRVVPTGIMYVRGTRFFDNIVLNTDIFLSQGGELEFDNGVEVELADTTVYSANVPPKSQTREEPGDNLGLVAALVAARSDTQSEAELKLLEQKSQYKPVQQAQIIFPDESLQLGRTNKALIGKLVQAMEAGKDALFVSSCGGSYDSDEKALKRAIRVEEEFLLRGVPRQKLAIEKCNPEAYPSSVITPKTVMVMHSRPGGNVQIAEVIPAAQFPVKPLIMTIPDGAGGATDYQARIVTMVAGDTSMLGQPITIVNKPGEGGRAGWTWFVDTASDTGYELASYNVPHFIAQSIKFATPYNIDTLEPLGNWGADPAVLVVASNSQFTTLRDFLLYARNNPGQLSVSGAGLFVGHHIALLQLEKATALDLDYRTARSASAALDQVVSGDVMAGFNNLSDAYRMGDKVRVLAIADLQRHEVMPEVPTFLELVVDVDDSSVNYRGLMVPKGTPEDVIDILASSALRMFRSPLVAERMAEGGSPMRIMSREEVIAMWQERQDYLTELLKGL